MKSFTAGAFIIPKQTDASSSFQSAYIPVEYMTNRGARAEFFVEKRSKEADLLEYFYAKRDDRLS